MMVSSIGPPSYDEAMLNDRHKYRSQADPTSRPSFDELNEKAKNWNVTSNTITRPSQAQPNTQDAGLVPTLSEDYDSRPSSSRSHQLRLPVVLPQTSKSFQGAFFSPFIRAYAAELEPLGIDQETFLECIDGLNEAFVSHPLFQVAGGIGGAMGMFGGALPPVQWAGWGLQLVSGLSGAATSYARTKAYVKAMNSGLFHPAGLEMRIKTTKAMMESVGYPHGALTLPPLETFNDIDERRLADPIERVSAFDDKNHPDDPRMRRIRALEGYVAPLDMNMPEPSTPTNLLRRMGNAQAQRLSRKQERKLMKEREKGQKHYDKESRKIAKARREGEKEMDKVAADLDKLEFKTEKKLRSNKALDDPKEQDKIRQEFEKERKKLDKEMASAKREMDRDVSKREKEAMKDMNKSEKKEHKTAGKIRWVIISRWEGEGECELESTASDDVVDE